MEVVTSPAARVDFAALAAQPDAVAYDAVDVPAIPANATVVMAYVDGYYRTIDVARARFPKARIVTIATGAATSGVDLGDCEGGDLSPKQASDGLDRGQWRAIYAADSKRDEILTYRNGRPFPWFAAEPNGVPHRNPYSIGTQFAWPGYGSPGNFDISLVDPAWLGLPPPPAPPAPPPVPVPTRSKQMHDTPPTGGILVCRPDGAVFAEDGAHFYGSMHGHPLAAPVVGIASTPTGNGYWMVGADGGIFNFGDARLLGPSPRLLKLWGLGTGHGSIPVTGIARGAEPGIAYTLISDTGADGSVPLLYRIPANGSLSA